MSIIEENKRKEEEIRLEKERKADEARKNALLEEQLKLERSLVEKCEKLNSAEFVELNVSGKHFTIEKSVLCSETDSLLAFMFSEYQAKVNYFLLSIIN